MTDRKERIREILDIDNRTTTEILGLVKEMRREILSTGCVHLYIAMREMMDILSYDRASVRRDILDRALSRGRFNPSDSIVRISRDNNG